MRWTPRALALAAALAIPWRTDAASTPASLPDDAAIRAGADLWFDEHIAPYLSKASFESPAPQLGTAEPAPENPLPARALGRRFRAGGVPPVCVYTQDPLEPDWNRPLWFSVLFDPIPGA